MFGEHRNCALASSSRARLISVPLLLHLSPAMFPEVRDDLENIGGYHLRRQQRRQAGLHHHAQRRRSFANVVGKAHSEGKVNST